MDNSADALLANFRFLASYNRWFNDRLYGACEQLPDAERRRDRGAFFGSIHGSLNHILWGDCLWLQRFASHEGWAFRALSGELLQLPQDAVHETVVHEDWMQLRQACGGLDVAIEAWVGGDASRLPALDDAIHEHEGAARQHPAWQAMTHFFNHQAHHRGQVTTLLSQAGVDVGQTDLIALA